MRLKNCRRFCQTCAPVQVDAHEEHRDLVGYDILEKMRDKGRRMAVAAPDRVQAMIFLVNC